MKYTIATLLLLLIAASVLLGAIGVRLTKLIACQDDCKQKIRLAACTPAVFLFTMLFSGLLINTIASPFWGVSRYTSPKTSMKLDDGCYLRENYRRLYAFCDENSVVMDYVYEIQRVDTAYLLHNLDSIYRFDLTTRELTAIADYDEVHCTLHDVEKKKLGIEPDFKIVDTLIFFQKLWPNLLSIILAFCIAFVLVFVLWRKRAHKAGSKLPRQHITAGKAVRVVLLCLVYLGTIWFFGSWIIDVVNKKKMLCFYRLPQYELKSDNLMRQLAQDGVPIPYEDDIEPMTEYYDEDGLHEVGPIGQWWSVVEQKIARRYYEQPDYYILELSPLTDTIFCDTTGAVLGVYNVHKQGYTISYYGMGESERRNEYIGCCMAGDACYMFRDSFTLNTLCRPLGRYKNFVRLLDYSACFCMDNDIPGYFNGDSIQWLDCEWNFFSDFIFSNPSDSLQRVYFDVFPDDDIYRFDDIYFAIERLNINYNFLKKRVAYPADAPTDISNYRSFFSMTVEKDGHISDIVFKPYAEQYTRDRGEEMIDTLSCFNQEIRRALIGLPPLPPLYVRSKQVRYKINMDNFFYPKQDTKTN